jgi:DnaJ like chaperone protein
MPKMYIFQPNNSWGIFIGSIVGVLLSSRFGFLGLLLGIYLGNKLDAAVAKQQRHKKNTRKRNFWNDKIITCTYQLTGHLAKMDGKVSEQSIAIIETSLQQFKFNKAQKSLAKKAFNQGKNAAFNPYVTIQRLQIALPMQPSVKSAVAGMIIQLVETDPFPSSKKKQRLDDILRGIGIIRFNSRNQHSHRYSFQQQQSTHGLHWAYQVLGVNERTPRDEVKRKYRKMLSDNHPDRLHSKENTPPSEKAIKQANEKTFEIKKAYTLIKAQFDTHQA